MFSIKSMGILMYLCIVLRVRELLQYLFCALRWASEAASSVLDFYGASHFKFPNLIHTIMLPLTKNVVVLCNQNTYVHSEVPLNVLKVDAV